MKAYQDLLQHILDNGTVKADRTGTGTKSVFGYQMRFDLSEGFPMLTTKKLHLKSIIYELLWFLNGDTNIKYLDENGVRIWDEWPFAKYKQSADYQGESVKEFRQKIIEQDGFAEKWGDLGPVYGKQWRSWAAADGTTIDQISNAIQTIKNNPESRRIIVNAWNVSELSEMALTPCHCLFQFYVANGKLSCQLYQRSADVFLGVPFNIASYALLTMMMAQVCDLEPGDFVHSFGDTHLYLDHLEQANLQLTRDCRTLPTIKINAAVKDIFGFTFDDFTLEDYNPHPHIKAKVSV